MITPPHISDELLLQTRSAVRSHYHCAICPQRSLCIYGHGQDPAYDFFDCTADTFATGYLAALLSTSKHTTISCQKSRKTYFRK